MKPTHILKDRPSGEPYKVYANGEYWYAPKEDFHFNNENVYSLTPLEATEETKEPETFDWKRASKLWGEGVEIQQRHVIGTWINMETPFDSIVFIKDLVYRIKPVSPVVKEYYVNTWYGHYGFSIGSPIESLGNSKLAAGEIVTARLHITTHDNVPVKVEILKP